MKRVLILIFIVVLSVGTFAAQGQRGQRGARWQLKSEIGILKAPELAL